MALRKFERLEVLVYALLQVEVNITAVKASFWDSYTGFIYYIVSSPGALRKSNNKLMGLKRCASD
jgi:hypothetical protein